MSIHTRETKTGKRYDVRLRDPSGRPLTKTFRRMADARDYEATSLLAVNGGTWVDPRANRRTFGDVASEWLNSNPAKRDSSYARDESVLRNHLPASLATKPLRSLTSRDLQLLVIEWVSEGAAPNTVRRQYATLRAVLAYGVDIGVIATLPRGRVKLPKKAKVKRVLPTPTELAVLVDELGAVYGPMALTAALVGARWGELAGLRVGDLDLLGRKITIRIQRTRGRKGEMVEREPKSDAGTRTLAIPEALVTLLATMLKRRGLTAADPDAYVFPAPEGGGLDYKNFRPRVWLPARQRAGLDGLNFHDLRRLNATHLVAAGVDIKTAQVRLGHSDVRLTLETYAQALTEADVAASEAVALALWRPTKGARRTQRSSGE